MPATKPTARRSDSRWWQRCLKMDAHGNYPKWWQWFIPRHGNWGAPGWSGGAWVKDPARTDWSVPPIDALDDLCREHDRDYQDGELWIMADLCLVAGLHRLEPPPSRYGRLYRRGAIVCFSFHMLWMTLTGWWSYYAPPANKGEEI